MTSEKGDINIPMDEVSKLVKKYKKLKKYQKSNIFAIRTMDGTEDIISNMIKEVEENPL
jgi:hypothetical protein